MKILNRRQIRVKVLQELYSLLCGNTRTLDDGKKNIIKSFIQTNKLYLFYLNFFKNFWEFLNHRNIFQKKFKKSLKPIDENYSLISNLIPLKSIAKNKYLITKLSIKESAFWDDKEAFLDEFFNKIVDSKCFKEYLSVKKKDFNAQLSLFIYIFKEILVHDKKFFGFIEDQSIYWIDDIPIINTFFLRLIKDLDAEKKFNPFKKSYTDIQKNTKFGLKLFKKVIENPEQIDLEIQSRVDNWDIERIAPIDRIIIKMSIVELNNFSEIPNVVTLNEYMEISKEYSTPKSSQFINGVLDSILKNLKKTD